MKAMFEAESASAVSPWRETVVLGAAETESSHPWRQIISPRIQDDDLDEDDIFDDEEEDDLDDDLDEDLDDEFDLDDDEDDLDDEFDDLDDDEL